MQPETTVRPRILIAEDNPQGVELLEVYLSDGEFDLAVATDGEATLKKVAEWKPDLILLDVMMPKISGFEVCKRLRADPATPGIAILMVTALDQTADIDRAVDAGTDDFLSKPINKTELLLRVRALLESKGSRTDFERTLNYIGSVQRGGSMTARVVLRARQAKPFFARHPWVFAGAIATVEGEPADSDEVDLFTHEGQFVARGLFNSQSKIRVRLYTWEPGIELDHAFFRRRLDVAIRLRHEVLAMVGPGSACRLVFSESDGLSGLTVDRYDRWLAVQFTSLALARRRDMLVELLRELLNPIGIYLRTERSIRQLEGLELHDGPLWGSTPEEPIIIDEDCLRFHVNLAEGQKTGFFLDQRDNRKAVARFAAGRRVLDAFCYTGGFGLHAAPIAAEVLGLDVSEPALDLARRNAEFNGLTNITFRHADVFEELTSLADAGEQFGLVVLDPPRFARSRDAVGEAMRAYRRLQALALRMLPPGGILVTCCCSGVITADMLLELLAQLAADERRDLQVLERRGPSPDHPVSVSCPETSYLKCFICRV